MKVAFNWIAGEKVHVIERPRDREREREKYIPAGPKTSVSFKLKPNRSFSSCPLEHVSIISMEPELVSVPVSEM